MYTKNELQLLERALRNFYEQYQRHKKGYDKVRTQELLQKVNRDIRVKKNEEDELRECFNERN